MSSPVEPPPPDIRNPASLSSLPQPPLSSSATPPTSSPFSQQLPPPPPITTSNVSRTSTAPSLQTLSSPKLSEIPFQHPSSSSSTSLPTTGPPYGSSSSLPPPTVSTMPNLPSPSVFAGSTADQRMSSAAGTGKTQLPSITAPPSQAATTPPPRSSSTVPLPLSAPQFGENRAQTPGTAAPRLTSQPTTQSSPPPASRPRPPQQPSQANDTSSNSSGNNNNSNAAAATTASSTYRPLNVRDALTYLDQVKVQFSAHPDVYNQFLDIMKDFKSQAIDTPGVIERVSILFHGHPDLISGFNTFLPPGYRIECSMDPNEPDVIKVTTPSGAVLEHKPSAAMAPMDPRQRGLRDHDAAMLHGGLPIPASHPLPPPGHYYQAPYGHMPPPPTTHGPPPPPAPTSATSSIPPSSMTASISAHHHHPAHPASYISGSRRPAAPLPPHPPSALPSDDQTHANGSAHTRRAPVEFNHAINYVNKIKNRFANEPDTYKQFLEILQTYQKERKPIQEVYTHVQYLFNRAPDLLQEFKQFLPEITGQPAPELLDELDSYSHGSKRGYGMPSQGGAIMPPGKKKRGTVKRPKSQRIEEEMIDGYPASAYYDPIRPTVSNEDVELFELIRKHIGNKPSYEEFLKILNLFTQQIIDVDVLLKQAEGFLGNDKDLFAWFKNTVAADVKEKKIERPGTIIHKPDLNQCATVESSPSYRLVPKEWQNQPCSGRDQLCWEVLNDEYVSHPIWASEDSGFVASRKNQYEEAMHRCEEERYDYDLNIDANLNVLALLEPIAKRLETMTPEQKSAFRLEPGLGGQSVTIYERIIKKIYEEDRGLEVIDMLYSHPARVVPILLRRLTQKDEEWRKAQHECNKTWREMDAKNFYRSLDYQGLTFKSNDRKAMAAKALVAEIETLHDEISPNDRRSKKYPLRFSFYDADVFKDITRIIFSYMEKQNGFSGNDRSKIRTFMRIFIPLFFHVDDAVPEGMDIESDHGEAASADDDDDAQSMNTEESDVDAGRSPRDRSRSPSRNPRNRMSRSRADDTDTSAQLLRDVLTRNRKETPTADESETGNSSDTPPAHRDVPPAPARSTPAATPEDDTQSEDKKIIREQTSADDNDSSPPTNGEIRSRTAARSKSPKNESEDLTESNGTATQEGNRLFAAATAPGAEGRTVYTFFCNASFYSFFRLYQMVYERLAKMKRLDEEMRRNPDKGKKTNRVALELSLYTNRFDDIDVSSGYYNALLELIDRLFDGEIDQTLFEEKTRYLFVTEAYVLFTIDKLVHSTIKQMQVVTMEEKCVELVELLRSDQNRNSSASLQTAATYRQRAERIVDSDENLYKVNFNTETHKMTIQLLDRHENVPEGIKQEDESHGMDWTSETQAINESKQEQDKRS